MNVKITNTHGEKLDAVVEGADGDLTVVMAHGLGTTKDENARLFIDISDHFAKVARFVRFDFSGYGQSEGREEDMDLNKMADDLASVLTWVRKHFSGRVMIFAHSLGSLVVRVLAPDDVERIILTSINSPDSQAHVASTIQRIQSRQGGVVNEHGITLYPRLDGTIQKIGSQHWKVLRSINPLKLAEELSKKTDLIIIKGKQDNPEVAKPYQDIPTLTYLEIEGDHNFTSPESRQQLLAVLSKYIK